MQREEEMEFKYTFQLMIVSWI